MKTIAVYGSLKRGKYNHSCLEGCEMVAQGKVKGTMYAVSSYPALVPEGDKEYDVEVYEVPTDTYNAIVGMELGAGYCLSTIDIGGYEATIFYASTALAERCKESKPIIDSY